MPIFGYFWELAHVFRTQGYDADAPKWSGRVKEYSINGLKVLCYLIVVYLFFFFIIASFLILIAVLGGFPSVTELAEKFSLTPEIIVLLFSLLFLCFSVGVLLILPYFYAPFIHTAKSKSLLGLFNLKQSFIVGTKCYWNVVLTLVLLFFLSIGYAIAILISYCTIIGPAFVGASKWGTFAHLLVQAFDNYKDESNEQIAQV